MGRSGLGKQTIFGALCDVDIIVATRHISTCRFKIIKKNNKKKNKNKKSVPGPEWLKNNLKENDLFFYFFNHCHIKIG